MQRKASSSAIDVTGQELRDFIRDFICDIRAGKNLDNVTKYMADEVLAHQVLAEGHTTIIRSPMNYREHIEEFQDAFGPFDIIIEEMLVDCDKVLVRWRQEGHHNQSLEGEVPTKQPLTEITSTVYRVENGKIIEYWLQTDRAGISNQLKKLSSAS